MIMHANDFSKTSHTSKPATSKRKIHEEGQENPPRKKVKQISLLNFFKKQRSLIMTFFHVDIYIPRQPEIYEKIKQLLSNRPASLGVWYFLQPFIREICGFFLKNKKEVIKYGKGRFSQSRDPPQRLFLKTACGAPYRVFRPEYKTRVACLYLVLFGIHYTAIELRDRESRSIFLKSLSHI